MQKKHIWELTITSLNILRILIKYYKRYDDEETAKKFEDAYYDILEISNKFYDKNLLKKNKK